MNSPSQHIPPSPHHTNTPNLNTESRLHKRRKPANIEVVPPGIKKLTILHPPRPTEVIHKIYN
jgi:hypothetical protein